MNNRIIVWLSLLFLGLAACGHDYLYEKSYPIEADNWSYADKLDFSFDIEDTLRIYNLWLEIEHTEDYSYQNLYIRINTHFPSGQQLQEPLSLELADKIGQWHGDCNGSTCTLLIPIQQGAFFNQTGTYQITLEQFMRQDPVKGIRNIGFRLEKTGQTH